MSTTAPTTDRTSPKIEDCVSRTIKYAKTGILDYLFETIRNLKDIIQSLLANY